MNRLSLTKTVPNAPIFATETYRVAATTQQHETYQDTNFLSPL